CLCYRLIALLVSDSQACGLALLAFREGTRRVEGSQERGLGAPDWIGYTGRALRLQNSPPIEIRGLAGFGLGDGVGVVFAEELPWGQSGG
ncbi:hypothetical protein LTR33_018622, partial [Friedmanniomyces endolithicus]